MKSSGQKTIYQTFVQPVYNLVYRITQNQADSLDITQDTFVKVFAKIKQIKSEDMLGFWIRRVALNTALSFLKKNRHLITNIDFKEKSFP